MYIHENPEWPQFEWNEKVLMNLLAEVRNKQGRLLGRMQVLGFDFKNEALLETLILDVVKSSEIEGLNLNQEQVRSSIARNLGLEIPGLVPSDRDVDGVVEMMLDATQNFNEAMSVQRLQAWHASMFPNGYSGMFKIKAGLWRDGANGPMQVVSGGMGNEKVHFEAPHHEKVESEMNAFLNWLDGTQKIDPVIKAGVAHLWFVTIHPFEDGNGRIARALTDLLLARSDGVSQRFYSMSAQIRKEREGYYNALEISQRGSLEITYWLDWFLKCLFHSLESANIVLKKVLFKHEFLNTHANTPMNKRQSQMVQKLLVGFEGALTSTKWAKINKCSQDTALRDIQDLVDKKVLQKEGAGGRSTSYELFLVPF